MLGDYLKDPIFRTNQKQLTKLFPNDFAEFNKTIGLPIKEAREYPVFPYQLETVDTILNNKHTVINKFVGAGMTEMIPRMMLWMMLTMPKLYYPQYAVITGTRMKFTTDVITNRILPLITRHNADIIDYHVNEEIRLTNGTYIRGYPTENLSALHGQHDLQFIFVDEAAFFHPNTQEQMMIALERNDTKSQPWIVLNSTPNGPQGAFYDTYFDALASKNDYKPITLNWQLGVGTIFTQKDLETIEAKKKLNPRLFAQEYNNEFIAPMGALTEEPQFINDEEIML